MIALLLRRLNQTGRIWRQLSSSQKAAAALLSGAALIAAVAFVSWVSTPSYGVAFKGLSEGDAAAVVAKLRDLKLTYRISDDGGTILVPTSMVHEVRLQLVKEGIPQGGGIGFEIFNGMNLGVTEQVQKINYQRALEGELSRTIGSLEAVKQARVHLAIPEATLYTDKQERTTASIVLELKPGKRLDDKQIQGIANLVAGSVAGLKPENLTIVDTAGHTLSANVGESSATSSMAASNNLEAQRNYEEAIEKRLHSALDRVLGQDKVAIQVSAVFSWDQVRSESESYTPRESGTAVRSSHELTEKRLGESTAAGGVPGTATNIPTYQEVTTSTSSSALPYERKDVTLNYELSKTTEQIVKAPGALSRLSVGVMLDSDTVDADTAQSISNLITAAVGLDRSRGDSITVVSVPFLKVDYTEDQKAMEQAQQQEFYISIAKNIGLALSPILLLLVLRLMLRRSVRHAATTTVSIEQRRLAEGMARDMKLLEDNSSQDRLVRQQVTTLARNEPALLSQLIHSWMEEDRR